MPKETVFQAAKSAYARRGKPAESTGWGAPEIHKFMRWQLNEIKSGRLSRKKVGGYKWELPSKQADGRPAALPKEVLAYHMHIQEKKYKDKSSESERPVDTFSVDPETVISNFFIILRLNTNDTCIQNF